MLLRHITALLFLTIIMLSYPFPTLMMRQNDLSALAWWTCKVKVGDDALCPGLHGSAGSGDTFALSCETGLLLITQKCGTGYQAPSLRENVARGSTSTLIGGKGMQYFIGNYGPDRIILVDPTESDSFRLIQLPTRRVHFVVDPVRAKFAYVFTEDGKLNQMMS